MAIPLKYNFRSLLVRRVSTLMTVVSIALVVAIFVGVMALCNRSRDRYQGQGASGLRFVVAQAFPPAHIPQTGKSALRGFPACVPELNPGELV